MRPPLFFRLAERNPPEGPLLPLRGNSPSVAAASGGFRLAFGAVDELTSSCFILRFQKVQGQRQRKETQRPYNIHSERSTYTHKCGEAPSLFPKTQAHPGTRFQVSTAPTATTPVFPKPDRQGRIWARRFFSLDRERPVSLFGAPKREMGGASIVPGRGTTLKGGLYGKPHLRRHRSE